MVNGYRLNLSTTSNKLISGLLLICCASQAQSQWLYLSPWSGYLTGNLGLIYKIDQSFSGDINQGGGLTGTTVAKMATSGFIYRPWLLRSRFNLSTGLSHNIYNTIDQELQTQADASITGDFDIYPQSDYPTQLTLQLGTLYQFGRTDSHRDRNLIKLNNNYRPTGQNFRLGTTLQWLNDSDSLNNRSYNNLQFNSDFNHKISENSQYRISLTGRLRQATIDSVIGDDLATSLNDANRPNTKEDNFSINYNQQWQLSDQGFSSLLASYTVENKQEQTTKQRVSYGQFSSVNFLQSKSDERLSFSASLLAGSTESEVTFGAKQQSGLQKNSNRNYNSSLGFTFDYSENLMFRGSANASHSISGESKNSSFSQLLSAQYQDNAVFADNIDYNWNGTLSLNGNQTSNTDTANSGGKFSASPLIGHNVRTSFYIADEIISFSAGQSLSHQFNDNSSDINTNSLGLLNHRSSISWSPNSTTSNSNVLMSISDTRHINRNPRNEQSLYITFQRSTQVDSSTDWGGDFVYEWRKTIDDEASQTFTRTASGRLWYQKLDLFDIPRLNYKSTLTLPVNKLLFDDLARGNDRTSWQNRLDFRMGLLEATAQMDMTPDNYHVSISVKRYFGMPL